MLGARPVFEYKIHVVHVTILQIVQPAHVVHFYEQLFPKESMLSPVPVPGTCTCTGKPDSIRFTMRSVDGMKGMVALGDTCIIGDCGAIAVLHWSTETCLLVSDSLVKISRDFFLKNIIVVSSCIEPTTC